MNLIISDRSILTVRKLLIRWRVHVRDERGAGLPAQAVGTRTCGYPRVIKLSNNAGAGGSGYHIENCGYPRVNNSNCAAGADKYMCNEGTRTTRITRIFAMNNVDLSGSN